MGHMVKGCKDLMWFLKFKYISIKLLHMFRIFYHLTFGKIYTTNIKIFIEKGKLVLSVIYFLKEQLLCCLHKTY